MSSGGIEAVGVVSISVSTRLRELEQLEPGWGDRGSVPPTPWALAAVRAALSSLADINQWAVNDVFLTPSVDGGIRMEWVDDSGRELTVIVPPDVSRPAEVYQFSQEPPLERDFFTDSLHDLPSLLTW